MASEESQEVNLHSLFLSHVRVPSVKKRKHAVQEVLIPLLKETTAKSAEVIKEILIPLINITTDPKSQQLAVLLSSKCDVDVLLAELPAAAYRKNQYVLHTFFKVFGSALARKLHTTKDVSSISQFVSKFADIAFMLYDNFKGFNFSSFASLHDASYDPLLEEVFAKNGALLASFLQHVLAVKDPFKKVLVFQMLFEFTERYPKLLPLLKTPELIGQITKSFQEAVIEMSSVPANKKRNINSYKGLKVLFAEQSEATLTEILNTLVKGFKRSREHVAPILVQFIASLPSSSSSALVSEISAQVLPLLPELFNSKDMNEREYAVDIVSNLAALGNLESTVASLQKLLQEGGLGVTEKQAVFKAITSIKFKAAPSAVVSTLCSILKSTVEAEAAKAAACDTLIELLKLEVSEGDKKAIAEALDAAIFSSGKELVRTKALLVAGSMTSSLGPLAEKISQLVVKSEQKPVDRTAAIYGLRVLLLAAYRKSLNAKLVQLLINQESFEQRLHSHDDHIVFTEAAILLLSQPQFIGSSKKSEQLGINELIILGSARALVNATSEQQRKDVLNKLATIPQAQRTNAFVTGFAPAVAFVQKYLQERPKPTKEDEETLKAFSKEEFLHKRGLGIVMLALLPKMPLGEEQDQSFFAEVFPRLIFFANHPTVNTNNLLLQAYYHTHGKKNLEAIRDKIVPNIKSIILNLIQEVLFKAPENDHSTLASVTGAISSLMRTFVRRDRRETEAQQNIKAKQVPKTISEQAQERQQKALADDMADVLSSVIQNLYNQLYEFSQEDVDVFLHEPTKEKPVFHNVDLELTKNPLFGQQPSEDVTSYELTIAEWNQVAKQETEMKQKNKSLDIPTIRKQLVTQLLQNKEAIVRSQMGEIVHDLTTVLQVLEKICYSVTKNSRKLLHQNVSLLVFPVSNVMTLEISEKLSYASYNAFHALCAKLCSPDPFPSHITGLISLATFRLKQDSIYHGEAREARGRILEVDDDIIFAEKVISAVRIATIGKTLDAESFSILLPFLQLILHRNILGLVGRALQKISDKALITAMSLFSSHVGIEQIRSGIIRPECCKILVEVLSTFPNLFKQAHNALISMAHHLLPIDLDPILEGLMSPVSVRKSVIKALSQYPPLTSTFNSVGGESVDDSMYKPENSRLLHLLWYIQYDTEMDDEEIKSLAESLWKAYQKRNLAGVPAVQYSKQIQEALYPLLCSPEDNVRETAAAAFAAALKEQGESFDALRTLEQLYNTYRNDGEFARFGVASALRCIAHLLTSKEDLESVFNFLDNEGLRDEEVKDTMVEAGLSIVNSQAEKQQDTLLTLFQKILQENQQQEKPKQAPQPKPQTPAQPKGGKGAQGGKKHIVIVKQEDMRSPSTPAEPQRKFSKQSDDYVVGTVVVYMGTLARYFAAENEGKLLDVINKLVDTLKLPSATVQKSVSNAVAPLLAKFKNVAAEKQTAIVEPILDKVLTTLANDKTTFGEKKGMCYGLTGIISGLGIGSIKNYQILNTLGALFKKGSSLPESLAPFAGTTPARESVMLAYGQLAESLGQLFEPYTVEIIPSVLEGINDAANERVRNAAEDCAAILMRKMTGHGVRMILPGILSSTAYTNSKEIVILGDGKTKVASIQLLGAMAYCSPRQLSEYLPVVVKALYESALSDTLPAVQQAAYKALERVGGAVHNPEIAQSMPHILNVLTQPSSKNIEELLDNLLHTRFLHSIDAASLALLIPIVLRGLKERHSEIKKKSATIVGSLSSLTTNPQDLFPYVDELLPLLQNCVVDPQPKVRQAAAKAVGVLAKSLGEQRLFKIIEWLQNNLEKNKENPVERSGAAQTLSEIIAAQGVGRLQELLPQLLDNVSTGQPQHIRHGYLQVFIFLPALMKSKFEPFLLQTLPKILEGLSDDDEVIRETAFSSSKVMVEMFATSSINMLVPALQQGMQSVEWRIRQSSLMLLSDFLKRIYVEYEEKHPEIRKAKDEEKVFEGEEPQVQISLEVLEKILSKPVLDNILALVFILQNDAHTSIKLKAAELWNQVVFHTPRQLRQILRVLLDFLVALLATESEDLRDQAARALGELVMKMGEKVIEEVIPILSEGLNPQSSRDVRHGVCIGLRELLQQSSEKHLLNHQKKLLEFVRSAVSDPDPSIQLTGAEIFDVMFKILGFKIINEMLSKLLKDLEKEASEKKAESSPTLAGLQQLIRVRGQHILNKLIPMIIGDEGDEKKDITELNARILSAVVEVGGTHLKYHVVRISTLLIKLVGGKIADKKGDISQYVDALQKSLVNAPMDELNDILELVGDYLQSSIIPLRLGACQASQAFFEGKQKQKEAQQQEQNTKKKGVSSEEEEQMEQEFKQKHIPNLLESLLRLLNDPVQDVVERAHKAIAAILGPKATVLKADEMTEYIGLVRETIRQLTEDEQSNKLITQLPGFNIPGGLDPLLQMFLHGLMNGQNAEIREQSAIGLGDLVELTSPKFITASYVLKIVGPLIRVAGERFPWQVKSAVLKTMTMLLDKVPLNLKAFLPQLQLSFVKNLQESNIQVRNLAAQGLGKLVPLCGTRVDPLITDVHNALKTLIATKKQAIQFDSQVQGNLVSFLLGLEAIFAPTKNATNPLLATLKPETIESLLQTLHQLLITACQAPYSFEQSANDIRVALAKSIALIVKYIKSEQKLDELIEQDLLAENTKDDKLAHGRISIIASMIEISPEKLFAKEETFAKMLSLLETTNSLNMQPPVKTAIIRAASNLLLCDPKYVPAQARPQIIKLVATGLTNSDNQVRYETARTMKAVAKQTPVEEREPLIEWIKSLLASVKDRFIPVKLASERAMVYLLAIRESRQAYENLAKLYVSKFLTEREEAKAFVEYCGKVLLKLSEEESEDEQESE